jgi:mono/diheme cytochrome c family protein
MPYGAYRHLSDTDVQALVAYMRFLPSIPRAVPQTSIFWPVSLFVRTAPQPVTEVVPDINRQDRVKYGEYLATLAGCIGCHTMGDGPDMRTDMLLGGGHAYALEDWDFEVVSSNLTPHATGLTMTEQQFVDRFMSYKDMANGDAEIPPMNRDNATPMSWFAFSGLTDGDLRSIYAYLRSVPPVDNRVVKRRPRER